METIILALAGGGGRKSFLESQVNIPRWEKLLFFLALFGPQFLVSCLRCAGHDDCPGDQLCDGTVVLLDGSDGISGFEAADIEALNDFEGEEIVFGHCRCPAGFTLFRWSCYPSVPELEAACSVSQQCRLPRDPNRHCSPISRRCACDFGFKPVRGECLKSPRKGDWPEIMAASTTTLKPTLHPDDINQVAQQIRNRTAEKTPTIVAGHKSDALAPDQIQTISYIFLAFFCVLSLGVVSALYMRSLKEKRKNQAAIRGLLDIMAGGGGGGSGGHDDVRSGTTTNHDFASRISVESVSSFGSVESQSQGLNQLLQSRIQLPPMEHQEVTNNDPR